MPTTEFADLRVHLAGGEDRRGGGRGPLLVLLHGFGAAGDDLVPLWRQLRAPPELRFAFPEGRLALSGPYLGARAWWQIDIEALERAIASGQLRDMSRTEPEGLVAAREAVRDSIEEMQRQLSPSALWLGGFSQGAMLALDIALECDFELAGLVLMSPTLLAEDRWRQRATARSRLRILLSHGRQDPLLPYPLSERLVELLKECGHDVDFIPFAGGHEISFGVLDALTQLLSDDAGRG